jgi:phosphoglycolate phosphatase
LEQLGYLDSTNTRRVFHLAPEKPTHSYLAPVFGAGYICSDLMPEKYPYAQCLRLALPEGFDIFPDGYFDLILHNHVLEHIPGDYRDHLVSFLRLLRGRGGRMIFTIPGVYLDRETIQGGELLATDEERLRNFGQSDHYKHFGHDFIDWFKKTSGTFAPMNIPPEIRDSLGTKDAVYIYSKT